VSEVGIQFKRKYLLLGFDLCHIERNVNVNQEKVHMNVCLKAVFLKLYMLSRDNIAYIVGI